MENILFYKEKANHFEESLPLGNGRIGAAVFGGLKKERIALNEDSLWSGYPKDLNKKDAHKYLDAARQAIFAKDYNGAEKIMNEDMHGHWSEAYMPFGDIIIEYDNAPKKHYCRTLDISKGIATVTADGFKETVFVSHPAQLLVINIECESNLNMRIHFQSKLKSKTEKIGEYYAIIGQAPEVCMPPYYNVGDVVIQGDKGTKFCGLIKVIGEAEISDDFIEVKEQKSITLLVSLATSFIDFHSMPTGDAVEKARSYFENEKEYKLLLEEHINDFLSLFDRVDFHLEGGYDTMPTNKRIKRMNRKGDDYSLIALLYQYGRYLTISGSRPGTNAMTLQGIWNVHLRAPWSSSYTTNINTEMNYWCTDSANLSECFEPLIDYVKKLAVTGKTTAKDYYGCRGFCGHHNSDIWGASYPAGDPLGKGNSTQYAPWFMSAPWFLNQLYTHYLYTLDEDYKAELIELYKECLDFFKDMLVEYNGELVTCPSISPENNFKDNGRTASLTYMPTMDRGILLEFFENCRELGFDDVPVIKEISLASDGRIPEWAEEFQETEVEHRHSSHLYFIYPSRIIQSKELQEGAKKSLMARGFGGTGWALGWKVCLWARLGEGEKANKLIHKQLTYINPAIKHHRGGGSYPNLLDAHPPFQIDGNFGVCAGIGEMLKNKCLPANWTGHIKGLRDYGGKEISYSFENGQII